METMNSRILKSINKKKAQVVCIGTPGDLTYPFEHLGTNANVLEEIASGSHPVCEKIKNAKLPMMIVGRDALTRTDSEAILKRSK